MSYSHLRDNTYILYIDGDEDSLLVAEQYAIEHDIPSESNLVPISIDSSALGEILGDQSEFDDSILTVVRDLSNPACIILSYNVPIGFYHQSKIISAVSRLMDYNSDTIEDRFNKFFNTEDILEFSIEDHSPKCLICSSLHSYSVSHSLNLIKNSSFNRKYSIVRGKYYIDPFTNKYQFEESDREDYTNSFNYVTNVLMPYYNIPFEVSQDRGQFIESGFSYLMGDSFYWGWGYNGVGKYFFQNTFYPRIMFLNIDDGGLSTTLEMSESKWLNHVIDAGYGTIAGFGDSETTSRFPSMPSFIRRIRRGLTIGESLLFSLPMFSTSFMIFGDPLVAVSLPDYMDEDITVFDMWDRVLLSLSKAVAATKYRDKEITNLVDATVDSTDTDISVSLIPPQSLLYESVKDNKISPIYKAVRSFFSFPIWEYESVADFPSNINTIIPYMGFRDKKISRPLAVASKLPIPVSFLLNEGWWEFSFEIEDNYPDYINYHFRIEIYTDFNGSEYTGLVMELDSLDLLPGWRYLSDDGIYKLIPSNGIPSSYIGRTVKYESDPTQYLLSGDKYYFKYWQYAIIEDEIIEFSPRYKSEVIYT